MKRINATFSDEIVKQIEQYKAEKGLATFAECIHQLVALGLENKKDVSPRPKVTAPISPSSSQLLTLEKILTDQFAWITEIRLLSRHLVANMPNQPQEAGLEILQRFKTRAVDFVKKIRAKKQWIVS